MARKYPTISVHGHEVFQKANTVTQGIDNVQGQILVHIFEAIQRLLHKAEFLGKPFAKVEKHFQAILTVFQILPAYSNH